MLPTRRTFLGFTLSQLALTRLRGNPLPLGVAFDASVSPAAGFPRQDAAVVQEMVQAAHGNFDRVKVLVERQPALVDAAIDWGFGDWETALGGPSHLGQRAIAEYLIARGASPTLFSAAMLGQLEVVKAFVAASPGCQRLLGPHSLTLMAHARAGGAAAKPVVDYLDALGDADAPPSLVVLDDATRDGLIGRYAFGTGPDEQLVIATARMGGTTALTVTRPGVLSAARPLRHLGNREFFPAGAESVRIRFSGPAAATTVSVFDPELLVTASRVG